MDDNNNTNNNATQVVDQPSMLINVLSCCFPIVGLILFIVWKDTKPKSGKQAGIGALVGVGLSVLVYIISAAFGLGAALFDSADLSGY